jgi:hypothetical protein
MPTGQTTKRVLKREIQKKKWEKLRCENLCKKALDFSLKFEQKLYTQQVDDVIMLQTCIQDGVVLHHVVFNT